MPKAGDMVVAFWMEHGLKLAASAIVAKVSPVYMTKDTPMLVVVIASDCLAVGQKRVVEITSTDAVHIDDVFPSTL